MDLSISKRYGTYIRFGGIRLAMVQHYLFGNLDIHLSTIKA
jgi:hypothetical protein